MEEKSFFEYEGVKVTNSRFIVDSQTFAMSNITSVKASEESPSRTGPILFLVVGALGLLGGAFAFGVICILIGGVWMAVQKTYYHVVLTTAGGESKALTSVQKNYVEQVVRALNDAIVSRG